MINDDESERIINNSQGQIIEFDYPNKVGTGFRKVRAIVTDPNPRVFFARELNNSNTPIGQGEDFTYLYEKARNVRINGSRPSP